MPDSRKRFSTLFSSGWICIWSSFGRDEVFGGAQELQRQLRLWSDDGLRFVLRFQSLFQNALDAIDVQEIEVQGTSASSVYTIGAVALGQTQQLLGLAQTAPGKFTAQKFIGEIAGGSSEFPGPLAVVVGPTQGVGSSAVRIIGVVGRAASGQLPFMGLDQLAVEIDTHQGAITADIDLAADPPCGNRIQCLRKAHMMVRMYFAFCPHRSIETFCLQRKQLGLLFRLEDLPGHAPGGSVDATTGNLSPDQRTTRYVVQIDERLPFEETFPCIGHAIFHHRFILRMMGPRRIGQKAPVVGILQKSPVETWGVGISLIDTRFHPVQNHAPRTTTKKLPGAFEAIDDRGQILFEYRDHAAQPAVEERHDEALDHARLATTEFVQRAEPPEIHFGHFTRQTLCPPHADRGSASEIAPFPDKAMQAAIGDRQSLAAKQLVDFAQQQVVLVQPGADLLGSRLQKLLRPTDRNSHSGPAHVLTDYLELALVRPRCLPSDTLLVRDPHDPPDGVPVRTGRSCYASNLLAGQPTPNDLIDVHPPHLPVCHPSPSSGLGLAHLLVQPQPGGG